MKKLLLTSLVAMALTGCGGGGGGSSSNGNGSVTPTFSFDLSTTTLSVDEGNSGSITITSSDDATYTVESNSSLVTATVDGKTVSYEVSEVDRDASIELTIKGVSGSLNKTKTVSVNIANVSAVPLIENIESLIGAESSIVTFAQSKALNSMLADLSKVSGANTQAEVDSHNTAFSGHVDTAKASIESRLDVLESKLSEYRNGDIADSDLETELANAFTSIDSDGSLVVSSVNALIDSIGAPVENIVSSGYKLDETLGSYSLFVGNENLGSYSNDVWVFSSTFEYLDKVLPGTYSTDICSAEG